jgi:hypothetical protein
MISEKLPDLLGFSTGELGLEERDPGWRKKR